MKKHQLVRSSTTTGILEGYQTLVYTHHLRLSHSSQSQMSAETPSILASSKKVHPSYLPQYKNFPMPLLCLDQYIQF